MRHSPFRSRSWGWLAVLAAATTSACSHNWDDWLPQGSGGGGTNTTTSSTTTSGTGGGGGTIDIPGHCPDGSNVGGGKGGSGGAGNGGAGAGSSDNLSPLMKVPTLAGIAVCIERTEVTRGQYESWLQNGPPAADMPAECAFDTNHSPTSDWPPQGIGLDKPVAYVSWCDALAYCLANNRRLCGAVEDGGAVPSGGWTNPSQSEWFAACTAGGARQFPYGSDYQPSTCNGGDVTPNGTMDVATMAGCVDASGQVFDLSGNIWEWENDCSGTTGTNDFCRLRGGGYTNSETDLKCAADSTDTRGQPRVTVGFRCCADLIPD